MLLHLLQIFILAAVYHFLNNNGGTDLRIVHIAEEHLSPVLPVNHERRQHLNLLIHEYAAPVLQRENAFPIDCGILPQPKVGVSVDNVHVFAHVSRIAGPIISCTSSTSCQSIGSSIYWRLRRTLSGLAEENRVEGMRGLLTENCMASFSIG